MVDRDLSGPEPYKSKMFDKEKRFKEILDEVSIDGDVLRKVFDMLPGDAARQQLINELIKATPKNVAQSRKEGWDDMAPVGTEHSS